jgi:hypothetical protein
MNLTTADGAACEVLVRVVPNRALTRRGFQGSTHFLAFLAWTHAKSHSMSGARKKRERSE